MVKSAEDLFDEIERFPFSGILTKHRVIVTQQNKKFIHDLRAIWSYTGVVVECEKQRVEGEEDALVSESVSLVGAAGDILYSPSPYKSEIEEFYRELSKFKDRIQVPIK